MLDAAEVTTGNWCVGHVLSLQKQKSVLAIRREKKRRPKNRELERCPNPQETWRSRFGRSTGSLREVPRQPGHAAGVKKPADITASPHLISKA